MCLNCEFVMTESAGKLLTLTCIDEYAQFWELLELNEKNAFLFRLLSEEISENDLINALREEYQELDRFRARRIVCRFLGRLRRKGMIKD